MATRCRPSCASTTEDREHREVDEQSLRHPRPYARLEGIPHIEHSIPLDGINYSSRILTRSERDPDLTLEVARFADSPVR